MSSGSMRGTNRSRILNGPSHSAPAHDCLSVHTSPRYLYRRHHNLPRSLKIHPCMYKVRLCTHLHVIFYLEHLVRVVASVKPHSCCIPGDWPVPQECNIPERLGTMVGDGRFGYTRRRSNVDDLLIIEMSTARVKHNVEYIYIYIYI
jgi:hypothetical protein